MSYIKNKNTYFLTPKDNPKDRIEVIIGDDKQPDFYPQVKIQRWDNEVNFSARLVTNELTPTVSTQADKITWSGDKTEAHFYNIAPNEEHPEGGYEFEVILKEPPKTNVVEFTLETKGLDFFYQPELTQEEIDQGSERPENVVGSYAVYHSTKGGLNRADGMEYKTGKAFHIYRPKIIDSVGMEVWGALNVNSVNGLLTVTIPQDFLDKAVYPVKHAAGLTFGYTTKGASSTSPGVNSMYGTKYTTPSDIATVDSMSIYKDSTVKGVIVNVGSLTIISNGFV